MLSIDEIKKIIGKPEDETLEYKTILPPSKTMAMILASFANTKGGLLILGVTENPNSSKRIVGLSPDFRAKEILYKAQELLFPRPNIEYEYVTIENQQIFVVKIDKSLQDVLFDNKVYIRDIDARILPKIDTNYHSSEDDINKIFDLLQLKSRTTGSFNSLKQHYIDITSILNDSIKTNKSQNEISILKRILFSSCVDTFEKFLSDLLFEIFLANPNTMKSKENVTIEEVLNCVDIQEFIEYYAGQKIQKLQKGNIKGFLKETKPLADLNAVDEKDLFEINKILEIRHLFTHKNGVVDQKFINFFPNSKLGEIFVLTTKDISERICKLINVANIIDNKAIEKHGLITL